MKKSLLLLLTLIFLLSITCAACADTAPAQPEVPDTADAAEDAADTAEDPADESAGPADTQTAEPEEDRVAAPDFTVYDEAGNPVKLSDFYGKPVVLNFWASWCGPCKAEMPDFQEIYDRLGDQVQFMIVNLTDGQDETVETASAYIASQGYTFPVFYDTESEAAYLYGIRSIPTTYFIDAEGYAVAMYTGSMSAEILTEGISLILPEG